MEELKESIEKEKEEEKALAKKEEEEKKISQEMRIREILEEFLA